MVDSDAIRRAVLDNGLTLLTEAIPTVRSVSLGVWVKLGSRYEPSHLNGVAHFIEHMLFKGTATRSARDIAFAIDAMGGQLDAFTSKENACYYANVLDEHLPDALELLADLILNPRFDGAELERERGVILEEIASVEDSPEELLFERFMGRLWAGHPIGRPILGTRETVTGLDSGDLRSWFRRAYDPGNVVFAAAGNLEHGAIAEQVQGAFAGLQGGAELPATERPEGHQHFEIVGREQLEQVHLYIAGEGPCQTDPGRYAVYLLNALLGGSVSSRLFQIVREEHGLAYNVYSSLGAFSDAGYFWIYAGTRPEAVAKTLRLILRELATLCEEPVSEAEMERIKDHLKGSLMLGLESTVARMSNLARQEIYFGRTFDLDEILAGIDSVTADAVGEMARRVFADSRLSIGVLARRPVARDLLSQLADGVELPGGTALLPHPTAASARDDGGDN